MNFLLDESVDFRLAAFLIERGHNVKTIARDFRVALDDREVLSLALRERRTLITNDSDFGDLIVRSGLPHSGVILLRLRTTSLAAVEERLHAVLSRYGDRLSEFLTVTEGRIRARG